MEAENEGKVRVFKNYEFNYPHKFNTKLYGETIVIAPDSKVSISLTDGVYAWSSHRLPENTIRKSDGFKSRIESKDKLVTVNIECT